MPIDDEDASWLHVPTFTPTGPHRLQAEPEAFPDKPPYPMRPKLLRFRRPEQPAWARALRLRSEALDREYGLGAWQHRTTAVSLGDEPAWLRALRIRSEAFNQQYKLGEYQPRS